MDYTIGSSRPNVGDGTTTQMYTFVKGTVTHFRQTFIGTLGYSIETEENWTLWLSPDQIKIMADAGLEWPVEISHGLYRAAYFDRQKGITRPIKTWEDVLDVLVTRRMDGTIK